jgi:hypothetical protein
VYFSFVTRWLGAWLRVALTVLLALGPFLHAHYGASHLSGLHVDGMDSVHASHAHHSPIQVMEADSDDESAAVGVAPSYPRQWQLQLDNATWTTLVTVWVLFVAASTLLPLCVRARAWMPPAWPHLFATSAPPPSLAPPAHG